MDQKHRKCLYGLHRYCIVFNHLLKWLPKEELEELEKKWGSEGWVKLHCSMCIKAIYAKAKKRGFSVINML